MALRPRDGHDWQAPNLDALGVFYIIFAAMHTVAVTGGLFALWTQRHTLAVRMRGFGTTVAVVASLHVYLVLVLLAYPLNGAFKCGWEFWIMSILLPGGVALFQASNVRLLAYYDVQKELSKGRYGGKRLRFSLMGDWREWWRQQSAVHRTYVGICVGMTVQVLVTLVLFFGSTRFHAGWGLFGSHVDAGRCRRGTEWIPSVFWQFLWAAVFGPALLLRIRHIHDTHYWAWQTRLAIVAGLPGTPLWLVFVYSDRPALANINKWFVPSGWLLPGLIAMQFAAIFFPWWDSRMARRTLQRIGLAREPESTRAKNRALYSMASLDMQIAKNIDPLLHWAAEREFTAENIVFIKEVRDWKAKWDDALKVSPMLSPEEQTQRFEEAGLIFFRLVDPVTAKLCINIDSKTLNELAKIFATLRYQHYPDELPSSPGSNLSTKSTNINVIAPWEGEDAGPRVSTMTDTQRRVASAVEKLYTFPAASVESTVSPDQIPASFTNAVFDRAYEIVRQDVFLGTWMRYEARFSRPSQDRLSYSSSPMAESGTLVPAPEAETASLPPPSPPPRAVRRASRTRSVGDLTHLF
ncbi:hypothetical protein EJ06DRAFT_534089 [Trichodelitschia bisporula]|uniref:RGS domain-containing protein n=1 Tax=Trichodelitschia bisporula TaxID=703511 RepID=A0A6G1HKD9_9PEZI|nr:hypothetical protein EJ06DRAFT_534089 [Trichodelitschia bisporula]